MRTPRESAWGNFVREKATFCEDERLVGQMIIGRPRDIWDLKKSCYSDHVISTAAVVDAESWGEYVL